jgi:hypothetical protein
MKSRCDKYLEYLDKEMTIMGVLSAITVLAPAGILNAIVGEKSGARGEIWLSARAFIAVGSTLCVLAAGFFYKQRSDLAWFYGQICLSDTYPADPPSGMSVSELMRKADYWSSWWPYSWGFTALWAAFGEYLMALILLVNSPWQMPGYARAVRLVALWSWVIGAVSVAWVQWKVLHKYESRESPWCDAWADIKHYCGWKSENGTAKVRMPHTDVYTRLKPSPLAGVGVFAIRPIPRGTYIFEPDDDDLVTVSTKWVQALEAPLRRLYEDFCVLKADIYKCPSSFNKLTPSWYLNHSDRPNVAADRSLQFYALRDISVDEELTANYRTYSENPTLESALYSQNLGVSS